MWNFENGFLGMDEIIELCDNFKEEFYQLDHMFFKSKKNNTHMVIWAYNAILLVFHIIRFFLSWLLMMVISVWSFQMTKYKRTNFEEDDASSNGSVPAETPSLGPTRVVYYTGCNLWSRRSNMEKILVILSLVLLFLVIALSTTISMIRNEASTYRIVHIEDVNKTGHHSNSSIKLHLEIMILY